MAEELTRLGFRAAAVTKDEVDPATQYSIVVKTCIDPSELPGKTYYDVLDTWAVGETVPHLLKWDGLLLPSRGAVDYARDKGFKGHCVVVPHHWDPRLPTMVAPALDGSEPFRFGYMGTAACIHRKLQHTDQLLDHGMKVLDTESGTDVTDRVRQGEVLRNMSRADAWDGLEIPFNVHVCVREEPEATLGTNTKLSTAAALDHMAVVTPDSAYVDLLDLDYPYYVTDQDPQSVIQCLEQMEQDYQDQNVRFMLAQDAMHAVRDDTSLEACARRLTDRLPPESGDGVFWDQPMGIPVVAYMILIMSIIVFIGVGSGLLIHKLRLGSYT